MGVGVVGTLWPKRPQAAAVVLLHARCSPIPGAGHFYTDASLPEHDAHAAGPTRQRIMAFLR